VVTQINAVPPNPEVISAYSHGWKMLWKPFWILLLIGIIYFAISAVVGSPQWVLTSADRLEDSFTPFVFLFTSVYSLFSFAFSLLVGGPLSYSISYAFLKAARREEVDVADLFTAFRKNYWNSVGAGFLTGLIIGLGFIFLIIPGIYLACKLAFVPYLVIDKRLNVTDAMSTSWKMTGGYGWQVFLLGLLAVPIVVAGVICLGIGVIISIMWISIALASLYFAVDSRYVSPVHTPPQITVPPAA
jgi:uncharacterized membrane protein